MNKAKRATLRALIAVGYGEMLTKVRRDLKGLKIAYLFSIQIIGEYPEGIRVMDICAMTGHNKSNVYNRLLRCIAAGYVYKQNKKYYLTEKGHKAYQATCKEFDVSLKKIIAILAEEVSRKV